MRNKPLILVSIACVAIYLIWRFFTIDPRTPSGQAEYLERARFSLERGNFSYAEEALRALDGVPEVKAACLGHWACLHAYRRNYMEMHQALNQLDDQDATSRDDIGRCVSILINQSRLSDALHLLMRLDKWGPRSVNVVQDIVRLRRISGINYLASEECRWLLEHGDVQLSDLRMLCAPSRYWITGNDREFLVNRYGNRDSDDLVDLAYCQTARQRGRQDSVHQILEKTLQRSPNLLEAHGLNGLAYVEASEYDELATWAKQVSVENRNDPIIWLALGASYQHSGKHSEAVGAFIESISRHPHNLAAWYHITKSLLLLNRQHESEIASNRAAKLARLDELATNASVHQDQAIIEGIIDLLEQMGRVTEAYHWCRYSLKTMPDAEWLQPRIVMLRNRHSDTGKLPADSQLEAILALRKDYPAPGKANHDLVSPRSEIMGDTDQVIPLSFVDVAKAAGLNFKFFNGADPSLGRAYMFEFSGPGVGVCDYDGDHRPDIYLTQGAAWPVDPNDKTRRNAFYRNREDGLLDDVAILADASGMGYGQGVAVGDLNSDGFDDLYICGIGKNICYLNLGDGTFSNLSISFDQECSDWSISAVIVDLNEDAMPEIFVANYLAGTDLYTRGCVTKGKQVQCFPQMFPPAIDRLLINRGDGEFADHATLTGVALPDGKGMAAVATTFGSDQLGIFVANDTTPNSILKFSKSSRERLMSVVDHGIPLGVAFSQIGTTQSSMGVDAADVNGDGLMDFAVTNFFEEPNNLFIQQADGTFIDDTKARGIFNPSYSVEGWGLRFFDADFDGDPDLFVCNGHLEDFLDTPGTMPQHLFRNRQGKFELVAPKEVGNYFEGRYFGRSVAQLDWNLDGLNDLCVTHTDAPIALLENKTKSASHWIKLHFTGTLCSRDAIGTKIHIKHGGREIVRCLSSGGYASTSERAIDVGVGESTRIESLEIRWPDGEVEHYKDVDVDKRYQCIQKGGFYALAP